MKNVFLFFLFLTSLCFADVSVRWSMDDANAFLFRDDGTTPLPVGSVMQLIWVPADPSDMSGNTPLPISSPSATNPFLPGGSEQILQEFLLTDEGFIFNQIVTGGDSFIGGFVYTRAFDFQGPSSNFNPSVDSFFYGTSSVISGPLGDTGANPPATFTGHDPFPTSFTLNQEFAAIPEPATLAIAMMGGVVLIGLRRRFRK